MPFLTSSDPAVARQRVVLGDAPITLGRHPECEVIIEAGAVSRKHAQIRRSGDDFLIADLGSRNGTVVNRTLIDGPTRLFDGSEISICDVLFVYHQHDPELVAKPRTTVGRDERNRRLASSFLLEDDPEADGSTILGQLDIPSHHSRIDTAKGAEAKLKAIISVTDALRSAADPESILSCVVDTLFELFVDADRGFIAMREPDSDRIVPFLMKTRRGVSDENVRLSRTIVNAVMESQQAILSSDAAADSRFDMSQSLADFRIRSMMAAPLVNSSGKSVGVLQIDSLRPAMAFSQSDLETLVTVTSQASLALQKFELYREAEETRKLEQDLKLAQEVQMRFLPDKGPRLPGFEFHAFYRPTTHVGGDYYDYIQLDENRCAVIVADVVGHGVAAALLMAKIAAESRFALALQPDPLKAMARINNAMSGLNLDKFVTFLLCMLDSSRSTVTFVNAGHMPPIVSTAGGSVTVMDDSQSGLPIGIMSDYDYESVELEFPPGTTLVLHTDGVNEAMNADGVELTTEKVVADLASSQAKTPDAICRIICDSVQRHVGTSPQTDDICVVCISRIDVQRDTRVATQTISRNR